MKVGYGQLTVGRWATPAKPAKVKKFSLGYNYNLSKRTNLATPTSRPRATTTTAPTAKNTTAYAFGLRHVLIRACPDPRGRLRAAFSFRPCCLVR